MTAAKARTNTLAPLIDALPEDWALTAVDGHKRPIDGATGVLMNDWQLAGQSRELLKRSHYTMAVGAICGPISGGLLVVDFDGPAANASLQKLTGGFGEDDLPPTCANNSGKPHRKKFFFSVTDRDLWPLICGIGTTKEWPNIEILWEGRQAVSIGAHPEQPNGYFWLDGCSPNDLQVAEAPAWLIDPLIDDGKNDDKNHHFVPSEIEHIAEILSFLNPDDFGEYSQWSQLGMACKIEHPSSECEQLFDEFSRKAPKYDGKFLTKQWKAWSTMEQFKQKRPNSRPRTMASFAPMAMANGMPRQKPAKASGDAERLEAIVREQTSETILKETREAPNLVNLLAFLRDQKECTIKWDELKRCIVIDGASDPIEPTLANVFLADKWKINASKNNATDVLTKVAHENAFNPVAEYFEQLRHQELPLVTDAQLADCFGFDEEDDLSIQLMRVHLRASVDRGLRPGGKMDTLLIIKGPQGYGKSTAVKILSPYKSWYDETTRMQFDSRDSLSALNSAFIYEFSEIEKILTTADVAQFKSWITRENDKYVEKFERVCKDHPRRCCLFGTTNASSFLMDPTGARRFLICDNVKPANTHLLKRLRDAIWKQSLIELESGYDYFLSDDSPLFIRGQERAQNATIADPWEAEISSYTSKCKEYDFVSSHQLLKHLGVPTDKWAMRDFKRLGNIMKRLGWEKARRRQAGHSNPVDGYTRPALSEMTDAERNEFF